MGQLVAVEDRLNRLERDNRRLRLANIAMLVGFVGVLAGGAAFSETQGTIVARELVIVGPDDDPRIRLRVEQDGGAFMSLSRADDRGRVVLIGSNPGRGGAGEIVTYDTNGAETFRAP